MNLKEMSRLMLIRIRFPRFFLTAEHISRGGGYSL